MYQELEFKIRGIAPLIMNNGQKADPLNEHTKNLKSLTKKRGKTDADIEAIIRAEWFAGLYVDDQDHPVIPGVNLEAALCEAAAKVKSRKEFRAGLICDGDWLLQYEGEKTACELWKKSASQFNDYRGVKVGQKKIFRSRPIFRKWGLAFKVNYLPDVLNKDQIVEALAILGRIVGIGDYKPKFGRFEIIQ